MKQPIPRPTVVIATAGALTLASMSATAAFLVGRYPALPIALPVHFRNGGPDLFMVKSYGVVLMPLWTQLILAVVIGSIAVLLLYRAGEVEAGDPHAGQDRDRMLSAAEAIALLGLVWISFQLVSAYSLTALWRQYRGGMGPVYYAALITATVLSVVIGGRSAMKIGRPDARHANDHAKWRLKALYFNPADPALFVPARYGYGLTLNFGRPIAIAMMLAVLLAGLGGPFLLARAFLR